MFKKWIAFSLFVCACLLLPAGAKRLTCGFKIAKMRLESPFRADWEAASQLSETQARAILAQPFRYLNRGAQCYAFLSEDGEYVLKLFRFDHFFRKKLEKHLAEERISRFFAGCKLASEAAPEETGLAYLHLNQTSKELPVVSIRGPLGQPFRLALDQYRFALQKKATLLDAGLIAARAEGKLQERIEEIVKLLESRIGKGIGNTDPSLWRNFGFLEDRAIELDFGNYIARPDLLQPANARAELERYMGPLRFWLKKHAPEYLAKFNARLEAAPI